MSDWQEDLITTEAAGTLDGLFEERVRRTPEATERLGEEIAAMRTEHAYRCFEFLHNREQRRDGEASQDPQAAPSVRSRRIG